MGRGTYHPFLLTSMLCGVIGLAAAALAAAPATQPAPTSLPVAEKPVPAGSTAASASHSNSEDLTGLSLEQLMQVEVDQTNSLTKTDRSLAPAAITTIDRDEIDQSGARSLTALLDIYVPNFESFPSEFEQTFIGDRGIIGDRDNKTLILVNSQDMNERSHGFLPELDQLLKGDFQEVDMVRGPGGATYGPGAINGVVSAQTFNGLDYHGTALQASGGFLDEYYSFEAKHGQQLTPDSGWFFYGGFAQLTGANSENSPIFQDGTFPTAAGTAQPGNPLPFNQSNEQAEYDKQPQIKLHGEYDNGGFTLWTRYTRGGESDSFIANRGFYAPAPAGFTPGLPGYTGVGYEQLTGFAGYKGQLSDQLQLDTSLSYQVTNFQRIITGFLNDDNQEQKGTGRAILTWQMTPDNSLAAGVEYRNYYMGLPSWMSLPDDVLAPTSVRDNGEDSGYATGSTAAQAGPHSWMSYLASGLAEDQWHINKQWTLFLSGRADKDRYTNFLFSPRESLAFQPNDKDTFKQIFSQSTRTTDEEDMRAQRENSGELSKPEVLTDYELRYERKQSQDLFFAASAYYNRLYAVDWNGTAEEPLGFYKTLGFEVEASYRTKDNALTISHGYTKLVGQHLSTDEFDNITAALYGDGYDLNNWSDNVTKITGHHQFNQHLSVDGNVQVLWGYPGAYDARKFQNSSTTVSFGTGKSSAFDSDVFLNFGCEYKFDDHSTVRLDAYNVLSLFDQQLSKEVTGNGDYRVASPAFALSYNFAF